MIKSEGDGTMTELQHGSYGMISDDDGNHWRGFVRHYPSGEVYIIEQDSTPGESANWTALLGPIHHSEITADVLANAIMSHGDPEDLAWAADQTWEPVA